MTLHDTEELSVLPLPDFAEESRLAGGGEKLRAVRGKRERIYIAGVARERPQQVEILRRAQFHFTIASDGDDSVRRRTGQGIHGISWRHLRFNPRHDQFLRHGGGRGSGGAGVNPGLDRRDLFRQEFLALAGRHDFLFAILFETALDHLNQETIAAFPGYDSRANLTALHQGIEAFEHKLAFWIG